MTNQDYLLRTIWEIAKLLDINPKDFTKDCGLPHPLSVQEDCFNFLFSATPKQMAFVYVEKYTHPFCKVTFKNTP